MLGDYGEVYVLDWGLARVLDERREDERRRHRTTSSRSTADPGRRHARHARLHGRPSRWRTRTRSARQPTSTRSARSCSRSSLASPTYEKGEVLTSTLTAQTSRLRSAAPTAIPPELDARCVAALARLPANARPRASSPIASKASSTVTATSRRAIESSRKSCQANNALASGDPKRRADAMQSAGRALALDPKSRPAADLVTSLILEPPKASPNALREQSARQRGRGAAQARQGRARIGHREHRVLRAAALIGVTDWALFGTLIALRVPARGPRS